MIINKTLQKVLLTITFVLVGFILYAQNLVAYIEISGSKKSVCQGQSLSLTASPTYGSGNYIKHEWITANGDFVKTIDNLALINTKKSGVFTYRYKVTDDTGSIAEASVTIEVIEAPEIKLIEEKNELVIKVNDTNSSYIVWIYNTEYQKHPGNRWVNPLEGKYRAVVNGRNGCKSFSNQIMVK